jgi:hypothetical protein
MMVTVWYVKKKLNCKHFYFVNTKMYNKAYWQEVKIMTTNLNIGDRILKLETFLWLQSI